jgi:tetratricopeptide (TPR) repeat protein
MSQSIKFLILTSAITGSSLLCQLPASALDAKLERYEKQASDAFANGDYKKAQTQWLKLNTELGKTIDKNSTDIDIVPAKQDREKTLRQIAKCYLAQQDFKNAKDWLEQARQLCVDINQADPDLESALTQLGASFRQVDPNSLGEEAANALKDVGAENITVSKIPTGQHIEISLSDRCVKPINQKGVSHVGFEKLIAFDLSETADGIVNIDKISGLKVKAQVWVNIVASQLKKDADNKPIANVTGEKLGISQSVSSALPDEIYQPLLALIDRVRNVFNAVPSSDIATGNQNAGATTPDSTNTAAGVNLNAQVNGMVPVSNGNTPSETPALTPSLTPASNTPTSATENSLPQQEAAH